MKQIKSIELIENETNFGYKIIIMLTGYRTKAPGALPLEAGDEAHQAWVLLGQVSQCS